MVLSAPVGGGVCPGRATSANRVTARPLSPMSSASTSSPWIVAAPGAQTAAWYAATSPAERSRSAAAAAVESVVR